MIDLDNIKDVNARIRGRDERVFHELYHALFARLCRYAGRYLYDAREAEDVVQEAFLSLWKHAGEFRAGESVVVYLSVLVKNGCLNYLRHLKIEDTHRDKVVEAMIFSGADDAGIDPDTRDRVRQLLEDLPDQGYRVVTEHVLQDRTIGDIAANMQVAESTVRTHLKRAMKSLRERIARGE
ncbi:MAG: sigma-70 family RNA polymerase sigma factor [Odoribacteraceae bacterium]|jgi:RNA polymerase sigma-70 factor (ECF subfamily)|nr:sigma-70 family RNA polymerase sigma factor [Odoribacteraceae bacterium]